MKKVLLILIFMTAWLARGQDYDLNNSDQRTVINSYERILKSDSTIWNLAVWDLPGSSIAKIIHRREVDSEYQPVYFYSTIHTNGEYEYMGEIREDSLAGQLWWRQSSENDEVLIMDLSLKLDDTFEIGIGYSITVDSVYYLGNKKVIRFDVINEPWGENLKFIEGVGPDWGILYRKFLIYNWFVSCVYSNTTLTYQTVSPFFDGCELNTTDDRSNQQNIDIIVFPNPTNSLLKIHMARSIDCNSNIQLIDKNGRIQISKIIKNQDIELDLTDLYPGIYTIFINSKNFTFRKKIIVIK